MTFKSSYFDCHWGIQKWINFGASNSCREVICRTMSLINEFSYSGRTMSQSLDRTMSPCQDRSMSPPGVGPCPSYLWQKFGSFLLLLLLLLSSFYVPFSFSLPSVPPSLRFRCFGCKRSCLDWNRQKYQPEEFKLSQELVPLEETKNKKAPRDFRPVLNPALSFGSP